MNNTDAEGKTNDDGWEKLAKDIPELTQELLKYIKKSCLPGTNTEGGDLIWPKGERIRFLKTLCGESE